MKNQRGQSMIEVAAMMVLIVIIVVGAVSLIGHRSDSVFSNVNSALTGQ